MPKTITFYTVGERKPKHNQDIIYVRPANSFGFRVFDPRNCIVEYSWFCTDDKGEDDGWQILYSPRRKQPKNTVLEIMFDGCVVDNDWLWCPAREFWNNI